MVNEGTQDARKLVLIDSLVSFIISLLSVWIYAGPLLWHTNESILGERNLVNADNVNPDVYGSTPLVSLLFKDYHTALSLSHESSFKKWRPLAVLSLRWFNSHGLYGVFTFLKNIHPIYLHRVMNVAIHTVSGHFVGILSLHILPYHPENTIWSAKVAQWTSALLFLLHPAHVEVVANVAHRPHLMALFFQLFCSFQAPNAIFMTLWWILGLASCETMIFSLPAILVTSTAVQYYKDIHQHSQQQAHNRKKHQQKPWKFLASMDRMLSRYLVLVGITTIYLVSRALSGTLLPPEPSINNYNIVMDAHPFAHLEGLERFMSHGYIIAIHIGKAFGIDFIGFAHEFADGCIQPISTICDARILIPLVLFFLITSTTMDVMDLDQHNPNQNHNTQPRLWWCMFTSWFFTLFPIAVGIAWKGDIVMRMGVFIADRIVLPSTVPVAIMGGYLVSRLVFFVSPAQRQQEHGRHYFSLLYKCLLGAILVMSLLGFWGVRVVQRTHEWTHYVKLLSKTRQTCPQSVKTILDLATVHARAVIHSERSQDEVTRIEALLEEARQLDPTSCRMELVQSFVCLHQAQYNSMKAHLERALDCPATAKEAKEVWDKYSSLVNSPLHDYSTAVLGAHFHEPQVNQPIYVKMSTQKSGWESEL